MVCKMELSSVSHAIFFRTYSECPNLHCQLSLVNCQLYYSTIIGLTTGSATSSTVVPTNNHTIRRTIATTTPMTNHTFFFFIFMLFCFYYGYINRLHHYFVENRHEIKATFYATTFAVWHNALLSSVNKKQPDIEGLFSTMFVFLVFLHNAGYAPKESGFASNKTSLHILEPAFL